jgi:hypothetical protein
LTKELKEFAEGLPEERRKNPDWYDKLKKELDEHADRIEARLRRFYIRALIGFAVLGIACAMGLSGLQPCAPELSPHSPGDPESAIQRHVCRPVWIPTSATTTFSPGSTTQSTKSLRAPDTIEQ